MESIDEYGEKIFMVIALHGKTRFNELYRKLRKYKVTISKPTLVQHLNDLVKEKVIQRTEENKQKVTYDLNWQRLKELQKAGTNYLVTLSKINEKRFRSKDLDEQTLFIANMLAISELYYLKLTIQNILEPENELENYFAHNLMRRLYNTYYTQWLLNSAKESKENSQKILTSIDRSIETIRRIFFDLDQEPTQQKSVMETQRQTKNA